MTNPGQYRDPKQPKPTLDEIADSWPLLDPSIVYETVRDAIAEHCPWLTGDDFTSAVDGYAKWVFGVQARSNHSEAPNAALLTTPTAKGAGELSDKYGIGIDPETQAVIDSWFGLQPNEVYAAIREYVDRRYPKMTPGQKDDAINSFVGILLDPNYLKSKAELPDATKKASRILGKGGIRESFRAGWEKERQEASSRRIRPR